MATFADLHPRPQDATEPDIRWRTSRTDRTRLQHLSPVIGSQAVSDSTGRYQRRVVPVMAHPATTLTWRAVGDPDRIRDLLTDLPSIGKHRGVGEGLVTRWEVSETPEVPDWVAGHEHEPGVLGRTAPPRCVDEPRDAGLLGAATVRPPYLHPASRTAAYSAGAVICRQRAGIRCLSDELKHPGASCDSRLAHADRDTTTIPAPTHPPRGAALSPQRTSRSRACCEAPLSMTTHTEFSFSSCCSPDVLRLNHFASLAFGPSASAARS